MTNARLTLCEDVTIGRKAFREIFKKSRNLVILTGAGISAESGIPTFRGAGGYWRTYQAQNLATPEAFERNPSLVWEFYHHRREVCLTKNPNPAHYAITECQKRFKGEGKNVTVITQNIDELHKRSGTEGVIELHGSLFKTTCLKCSHVEPNYESPICESLRHKGAPDENAQDAKIPEKDLPRCKKGTCGGLLRPYVVWFGESLHEEDLSKAGEALDNCDLCLVIGTSSVVYPAAMFAPQVQRRGIPVAEFNLEHTPATGNFSFHFQGSSAQTVPEALAV